MPFVNEQKTAMIDHEAHTVDVVDTIPPMPSTSIPPPTSLRLARWVDEAKAPIARRLDKAVMVRCMCLTRGAVAVVETTLETTTECLSPMDQHAFLRFKISLAHTSIRSRRWRQCLSSSPTGTTCLCQC